MPGSMTCAKLTGMIVTLISHALRTRTRTLSDGRRVSVRQAVRSDAPRLAWSRSADEPVDGPRVVAIDDHGVIVGWAKLADVVGTVVPVHDVAAGWRESGLVDVLVDEITTPPR
jgi:hypothetical protein